MFNLPSSATFFILSILFIGITSVFPFHNNSIKVASSIFGLTVISLVILFMKDDIFFGFTATSRSHGNIL